MSPYGAFQEAQGQEVRFQFSAPALKAALAFLYEDEVSVPRDRVSEVLHFAHMYNLPDFLKEVEKAALNSLDAPLAAMLLADCVDLDLKGLDSACERYALEHFEAVAATGRAIREAGMRFNAGHALNYFNVQPIAALPGVRNFTSATRS